MEKPGRTLLGTLALLVLTVSCQPAEKTITETDHEGFTLRIIFYGLIGLVPNDQGQGMTALMIEAAGHDVGVAALEDGDCSSGDCRKTPQNDTFDFIWRLPANEKLILSIEASDSDENTFLDLRRKADHPGGVPQSPSDLQGAEWLPRMEDISSAHQSVADDCLRELDCDVRAKLKITKAIRFGVCHFAHATVETETCKVIVTDRRDYALFQFKNTTHEVLPELAMADALWIEVKVPDASFIIKAEDTQMNVWARAEIKPKAQFETVTLVVSNNDFSQAVEGTTIPNHHHFRYYYNISEAGSTSDPFIPEYLELQDVEDVPPHCEEQLCNFEEGFFGADGAHDQRECDLAGYVGSPYG